MGFKRRYHPRIHAALTVGIGFLEASALDGTNVEEAFMRCARQILTKVELGTATYLES
jgi:hypothetical protein